MMEFVRGQTISAALLSKKKERSGRVGGGIDVGLGVGMEVTSSTSSPSPVKRYAGDSASSLSRQDSLNSSSGTPDQRGVFFVDFGFVCKSAIEVPNRETLDSFKLSKVVSHSDLCGAEKANHAEEQNDFDRGARAAFVQPSVSSSFNARDSNRYQLRHLELTHHLQSKSLSRDSKHGSGLVFEETVESDGYRYTADTYCRLYYISYSSIMSDSSSHKRNRSAIEVYRLLSLLAEQQQEHAKEHVRSLLDVINFNPMNNSK